MRTKTRRGVPHGTHWMVAGWVAAGLMVSGVAAADSPSTPPGAPWGLVAMTQDGYVHLAWQAPWEDGGSPIQSYGVYRSQAGGAASLVGSTTGTTFADHVSLAGPVEAFLYWVTATNAAGEGDPSPPAAVVKPPCVYVQLDPPGFGVDPGCLEFFWPDGLPPEVEQPRMPQEYKIGG